jgi:site-specific DNA-cytosine methylase
MKDKLKIISLCDGMSCGALALEPWLEQQGLTWDDIEYHAFEIDKYADAVSRYNYPLMYRHGDARNYKKFIGDDIFLLMGGFPCQPYSFSGKGKATEDERDLSNLIFDALKDLKPKYFLFENVPMKKEHQDRISEGIGVEPTMINSQDFSAHHRKRLYWTNIKIDGWHDLNQDVSLKDILEDGFVDRDKSHCIDANYFKGYDIIKRVYDPDYKAPSLTTMQGGWRQPKVATSELYWRNLTPLECERLQTVPDGYTEYGDFLIDPFCARPISNTQRYKMLGNGWTVAVISHIMKNMEK